MEWWKKAIIGVVAALLIFGLGYFAGKSQREDAPDPGSEGASLAEVAIGIAGLAESYTNEIRRIDDRVDNLDRNILAVGRALYSTGSEVSELGIRIRDFETGFGELGIEISGATGGIDTVLEDIGNLLKENQATGEPTALE